MAMMMSVCAVMDVCSYLGVSNTAFVGKKRLGTCPSCGKFVKTVKERSIRKGHSILQSVHHFRAIAHSRQIPSDPFRFQPPG